MIPIRSWRFAAFGLVAAICTMTFATTAPAYFDPVSRTASAFDTCDNVFVISLTGYQSAAFDILHIVKEDRVASQPPAFRHKAIKERASRSAVRPTAVSGRRSGRTRTLAA